jgi:hypothetical protein
MDDARPQRRAESAPAALWTIAIASLAPFPISAVIYGYGPSEWAGPALTILLSWAALMVAFLGGVRWGLETRERQPRWPRLAFSALTAAAALLVLLGRGRLPDVWILGGFVGVFLVQWLFDHQTPDAPARYPTLSTAIAAGACVSLGLALEKALNA